MLPEDRASKDHYEDLQASRATPKEHSRKGSDQQVWPHLLPREAPPTEPT